MNTKDMLFGIVIFAAGLFTGIFIGSRQTVTPSAPPAMAAPGGVPGGQAPMPPQGGGVDKIAQIRALQDLVAREPRNTKAWIQLGNDLFDTNQYQKSIDAYGKALELQPGNPDVLTDQGLMYRALGQFDQAVANFEKAFKADPDHFQSQINFGVVYVENIKKPEKAIPVLERVIQRDPNGRFGAQAKSLLEQIHGH